jgi:aryl-alcohol dehydrogenase-like predicted oxidoreductase
MNKRNLGSVGLTSSAIGLGTMGMTMAYGAGDEEGGVATIRRAHELGITMLDTAPEATSSWSVGPSAASATR